MTLYAYCKAVFFLLLALWLAPFLIEGIRTHYVYFFEPHTHLGVINIDDTVDNSWRITQKLHSFFNNQHIKGILLIINSTQQCNGTHYALFNEIMLLKKEHHKPIVALIENRSECGSYLIASAADYIIAPVTAYITMPQPHGDSYQSLIKQIASSRTLSLATASEWADGKTFTGAQAQLLRLVDETGSLHNAITFFKHKALIMGEMKWVTDHGCLISSFPIKIQYCRE